MTETTLSRVQHVLTGVLGCTVAEAHEGANLIEDLEADSLDAMEIAMDLEGEFAVEISDDDFEAGGRTVGSIAAMIEGKL